MLQVNPATSVEDSQYALSRFSRIGNRSLKCVSGFEQVEVVTPEDHMGDVIGDLNSRRGMVSEFLDKPGGLKVIKAEVPLSEMFQYVSVLRGMTKGRAPYTMTFEKYDNVPNQIQEKIVAENKVAA